MDYCARDDNDHGRVVRGKAPGDFDIKNAQVAGHPDIVGVCCGFAGGVVKLGFSPTSSIASDSPAWLGVPYA